MTRRALGLLLAAAALLLCGLASRNASLSLASLPFIAYLAAGALASPRAAPRLRSRRSLASEPEGPSSRLRVGLQVENLGRDSLFLVLEDELPPGAAPDEGSSRTLMRLAPGGSALLSYSFLSARGSFAWRGARALAADPLLLFGERTALEARGETAVRPKLRRLPSLLPNAAHTLRSPGLLPGGRAGAGTDFWGIREYRPGDPLKKLDWKRAARHPGRLFTRENEEEDIADFALVVDARCCAVPPPERAAFGEAIVDAAASLCELLLRGGNRVGMALAGECQEIVYPGHGKTQLDRLLRALARPRFTGAEEAPLDTVPLSAFSPKAQYILVSPVLGELSQAFARIRAFGGDCLLIAPDPLGYRGAAAADPAEILAIRLARAERSLRLRDISRLGVRVLDWKREEAFAALLRRAMLRIPNQGRRES